MPVTFREACDFVNKHHPAPQGMKFALGLSNGRELIGVLIAGRPVSRLRDNGKTIEVTRLCVHSAYKNACSKLYASAARIAKKMGYQMLITYTLEEEDGGSLRGVGFQFIGVTPGGSWHSKSRSRQDRHPMGPKRAWSLNLSSSQEE